jgi:predicted esterase
VMRYSLRAPTAVAEHERLGLVLCFHGAGGDERWLADPTLAALRANGVDSQFVVASLKSKGKDWAPDDLPDVVAFLRWAARTYPIDERRVVAEGVSNGSYFVNLLSSRHPELLAGVIGLCNGYGLDVRKSDGSGPAYYIVHGAADPDVNVKSSRHATATLRGNGYRVTYREYPGLGHDVFGDEPTRRDFARWLERLRSRQAPGEDQRKALAAFEKRDDADRLIQGEEGAEGLLRIGGVEAELVLARSLRSKSPAARAAAARLFARTACSPGAAALLALLCEDKEATVRQAAAQTLATAADWGDQDALTAICRFAGAKGRERDERLEAARSLAGSLAFRSTIGADNQLIYELFVHLLDDDELALRTLASDALARAIGDDRGYRAEATPAARREAVNRWRKWYLEQFAPVDEKPEKNERK